jgi:type I restriction enzyme S subunit
MTRSAGGAWATVKLGDLVTFQTGKLNSNAAKPKGKYPFFTCSQETFRTNTFSFDTECVLLAGNNANGIYPLKYFSGKFDAYQRTYIVRSVDPRRLTNRFLYYALFPKLEHFRSISTGAATKFLTLTLLRDVTIEKPPIDVQERIADILSVYDDLIENNTRRITILEEMAQLLYREWFVSFRFPGHENVKIVESERGLIPLGWEVRPLKELAAFIGRGISPTYDDLAESLVINQKCIRDGKLSLAPARLQSKRVPEEKLVQQGDVLINSTGVGTLGRVAQVLEPIERCTVDSHVSIVRPRDYSGFVGKALLEMEDYFEGQGVGSTGQTELSRERIGAALIRTPPESLQEAFSQFVAPMNKMLVCCLRRNEVLRTTRDLLLPKLVSGEVIVEQIQQEAIAEMV